MQYRLEQTYAVPPEDLSRAFADPGLYVVLADRPGFGDPKVLSCARDGDVVRLAVRYRFSGTLSGAARRAIDPNKLTWVEHSVHDLASTAVEFALAPDHYADRFRASGFYRFTAEGEGATRRVVEGEVVVRAPLVAGAVERAIVSGLRDHLAAEAPVVETFLAGRSG